MINFISPYKNKYFCLTCKKSFKDNQNPVTCPTCHNKTVIHISYKSRAPKINASKKKWKEFYNEIKYSLSFYHTKGVDNES